MADLFKHFFNGDDVTILLLLIALDFALGVAAALLGGTFRFAYFADFARDDLLAKVFPYMVVQIGAQVTGERNVIIPRLDLSYIKWAIWTAVIATMVASILKSLNDMGLLPQQVSESKAFVSPEKH